MILFGFEKRRKPFRLTTKKIEWMLAAGRDYKEYTENGKFYKTSYCRKCKKRLIWGNGSYDFDHLDNNSSNNSQRNCYLVCKNCHGMATKIKVIKQRDIIGGVYGHKTTKLKVGYKKPKKKKAVQKKSTKRNTNIFGFW